MSSAGIEAVALTPAGSQIILPRFRQAVYLSDPISTIEAYIPKTKKLAARPKRILYGAVTDPRLRLKRPIPLVILRKKGTVVVQSADLNEFGCGATMSDALDDLSKGLAELFFALKRDSDRLGPDLARLKDRLERYLELRTAR